MKGVSEKLMVLVLTTMMAFPMVFNAPSAGADGNGELITSLTWEGNGGYAAHGVGTWGSSCGTIALSGIPAGATIEKAFIYWVCPSTYGLDTFIYLNGNGISGTQIGKDGILYGYRAEVTSLVSGNGDYGVTDITTSYGASLVVVFSDPSSSPVVVVINDGMDTNYGQGLPHWLTGTTFSGFEASENPQAYVTYIMGDGQKFNTNGFPYDKYSFNGNVIAIDEGDGSDGNGDTHGWDTDTYDVSSYVSEDDTFATANIYENNDELNWVTCVFSVTTGPTPIPPIADAGLDQTVYEGDTALLDGSNSKGGIYPIDIENGMVSWWPADGNTDDIMDGNHGTLLNGATYDSGMVGQAFSFDPVNDCVSIPDSDNLKITKSLSIDAWLYIKSYPPAAQAHGLVIFRGDDRGAMDPYYIAIQPYGSIRFHVESTSARTNLETPIEKNKWVFVAATLDDATGKMRIYIDGALAAEQTTSIRPFKDLHPSYSPGIGIGNHAPSSKHNMPYHGLIDEMEVFNRVLNPLEIKLMYEAGSAGKYDLSYKAPIISYEWDFEGDGTYDYIETTSYAPDGSFDGITTHVYMVPGIYNALLRVTDETGATDTDTCDVIVLSSYEPPVADAGPDHVVNEGDVVQFNGSGSYSPNQGSQSLDGWYIQIVDSEDDVGICSTLDLDANGNPHISYCDWTSKNLKFAKWTGSTWNVEVVDDSNYVGNYNYMELGSDGFAHIGYTDFPNSIKHAKHNGGTWNIEIASEICGGYTTMALDSDDYPHISYFAGIYDSNKLKYLKWTGTNWEIETVAEGGISPSIAIDSNDYPHIAYYGYKSPSIRGLSYLKWDGSNWIDDEIEDFLSHSDYISMALDSNDFPHIVYSDETNGTLKYARWTGTEWKIEILEWVGNEGFPYIVRPYSIAIDDHDYPHISYTDYTQDDVIYLRWTGVEWNKEIVDSADYVGYYVSLKLDNNGYPHIAYYDYTNGDLKYASRPGDMSNLTYSWDFNQFIDSDSDGVFTNDIDATGPNPTYVYGDNGNFTVTLTVTDEQGLSDSDTCNISVLNVDPIVEIESAIMDVEIGLRVAGRKFNDVGMTLSENEKIVSYVSIERMPGSPDDQMAWIPITLDLTRTYSATVTYTPEDPPNIGGNPVWIYVKFPNGTIHKIHHTFNVQQSKKRDSDHWNHVEPWEVDLNAELEGWTFELNYHVTDAGSDDESLNCIYGSQNAVISHLNDPPNPDPYPSPEVNPRDIYDTAYMIYEGAGTLNLQVEDDDGGIGEEIIYLA
jgi:PKD repeat protein